ncbi:hypothetical protein J2W98_003946 [Paenibacillus peoriae]|uniref:50S ribosomal protein L34 n=1 Tax=Paenibacillus peoriae TaxID=59893 RepID=A0ABU1QJ88_9BACL|nr:hypothetical protein [Paenibacillus peoriae]
MMGQRKERETSRRGFRRIHNGRVRPDRGIRLLS